MRLQPQIGQLKRRLRTARNVHHTYLEVDLSENQHTLTVKMGLYCDVRKHERTFIQSLRGIGGWAGALSVGFIADSYGRKICMLISLVSLNVSFICKNAKK